jgi:hypothetical protein
MAWYFFKYRENFPFNFTFATLFNEVPSAWDFNIRRGAAPNPEAYLVNWTPSAKGNFDKSGCTLFGSVEKGCF